jgi:hypothetical protein
MEILRPPEADSESQLSILLNIGSGGFRLRLHPPYVTLRSKCTETIKVSGYWPSPVWICKNGGEKQNYDYTIYIDTDDPAMFGNTLAGEYQMLEERLGFSRNDIRTLILNGIKAAWLPQSRKKQMIDSFCRDENWLK